SSFRDQVAISSNGRAPSMRAAINHSKSYIRIREPDRGSLTSKYLIPCSSAGVARRSSRIRGVVTGPPWEMGGRPASATPFELRQHQLGNRLERVEHPDAGRRHRFVLRNRGRVEQ